ncbi:ATP-binding cassette domain-containing protein [Fluviispira multicolorata]|uniref:ATP-binding cassette domain-containing protein n=1 Tax=Fluviispira multicolorata TaxID=2654512 RepID=A0A833N2R6_9BACT|nr:ATP-binding cassette domain-containing protein [Fluviispira multicolorata]KAB8028561.1 ATP-binding cassette domain-containing protein [Fluviispira multicolorata]
MLDNHLKINEPAILFDRYSLSVGFISPIRELSFSIHEGQSVAIIGPAGSGKSMLLSIIAQFLWEIDDKFLLNSLKQSGNLQILGIPLGGEKPISNILKKIYTNVVLVSEKSAWLPVSIAENFALSQSLIGAESILEFHELIDSLPISHHNKAQIDSLAELLPSQVEVPFLQQLAIIRALIRKPKILLLDDAFLRMDPVLLKQTENLILNMSEKSTLVWATNDLFQASRVTDWTLFMRHGTMVEYTRTAQFFTNPTTRDAENFIAGRDEV